MSNILERLQDVCTLPGRLVGWLVVPLIVSVCLTVIAAQYGINVLAEWSEPLPLVGKAITVNTLLDLQWHIFSLMVLFGGVLAFRDNSHVAVDVFSSSLSPRVQLAVRMFGDLVFLLPFCIVIAWYGYGFAVKAFATGEGSTYGGMLDRWVIKAMIPVSFSLLGLCAIFRAIDTARQLMRPSLMNSEQPHD
ncbi:TRAP transporter small permease subunit [Hoeflea sp. AS16]|uniref:TRAP transporter small permease subunit n=1 Tax=unclassified Hoeflea TaxID=2614931 RepID=UPI00317493C9